MKPFDFLDINLIPQKCIVKSRTEIQTNIKFGNHIFKLPVIPANMSAIITEDLAINLSENNYFYIMHRFDIDTISFIKKMNDKKLITSISVGVNHESYELINEIKNTNLIVDYITIDIAHGHSNSVKDMIEHIRKQLGSNVFIIAGNISTTDALFDLTTWGADCVKIGIGSGHSCLTAMQTGFGTRGCQASTLYELAHKSKIPVISDGGITLPADINKSLVLGATMVMCGNILGGFIDSPGEVITIDEVSYKEYWGSASQYQSGKTNRIEGTKKLIPFKNHTLIEGLIKIQEAIQSAISYGGGNCLNSLNYVQFKKIKNF